MKKNVMKRIKKAVALFVASSVMLSLAACGGNSASSGGSGSNGSATGGNATNPTSSLDSIVMADTTTYATLQPYVATGLVPTIVTYGVYEALFSFDEANAELEPRLAKSYTTEDNLTYDIEIYDNIYDSAGNHITADDVIFSFEECKKSSVGSYLSAMQSIEKTGDYSVRIVLSDTSIASWQNTVRTTFIVSQKAYEESGDGFASAPVGTGPYVVTEFKPSVSVKVERRDDYWQTDESKRAYLAAANINEIELQTISEASQLAVALQTGTINYARIPQSNAQPFLDNPNYALFQSVSPLGMQLTFSGDSHSPVADNQKLRQAILYGIDVDAIITVAYGGYGERQYTYGPSSVEDFIEKWKEEGYYDYDADKAKKLLEEAGYKPGELKLQLLSIGSLDAWAKASQVIQQNLTEIGIDVEILNYDAALYGSYMNDGQYFDMMIGNSTQNYLVALWDIRFNNRHFGGKTSSGFEDTKLQELLEGCSYMDNHTPENVEAFHSYLKDQAYAYGLCAPENFDFTTKDVGITEPYYDYTGQLYLPCSTFASNE